jgi:hypothetical protein
MMPPHETLTFRPREFKGSRLRCLLLTSKPAPDVAAFLTNLVAPSALVKADDLYAPRGFIKPDEAKLGEMPDFLPVDYRETLTRWWLAKPSRANTPNWDIISKCWIKGSPGLLLIESKAHVAEFADDCCHATSANLQQIEQALKEASNAWECLEPGFSLSANSHYQLSNRFAFAWKLAAMGIPVVLVYLGFLNALDMNDSGRTLLGNHLQWKNCVLNASNRIVPAGAWDREFKVGTTPLSVLIRSADVRIHAEAGQ